MSPSKLPSLAFFSGLSQRTRAVLLFLALILIYGYYVSGLTTNPPGFYIDEAAVSYNAYTVYTRGEGEFGDSMPLYFPIFPLAPPLNYLGYIEPVQIYILAALHFIFPPGVYLSRGLSATAMFFTALVLGFLAFRISKRASIGVILGFIALITPWLLEMGRLAFGASLYPLSISLLLIAIYSAERKERWSVLNSVAIGLALAMTTYTYAIGRMLGPLLAFGLVFLAVDLKRIKGIFVTWVVYAITLIPMVVVYFQNPYVLTGRFDVSVGYMSAEKSYWQVFLEFLSHLGANVSPTNLFLIGDQNLRHHIADTAPIYAATMLMAAAGVVFILIRHRKIAWWRYVIFGLIASLIPASLTKDDFHMLRLAAFPVFLLVLTIPTFIWLLERPKWNDDAVKSRSGSYVRLAVLGTLLFLTLGQALSFATKFRELGPARLGYFDSNFPAVFAAAIERPERPIYLVDQNYYQALWQAVIQGIDLSNFVRLPPGVKPPINSVVLSGEERCSVCEMYVKDIPYVVYKTLSEPPAPPTAPTVPGIPGDNEDKLLSAPRGIAVGEDGIYYVADTGNSRIQKFDAAGKLLVGFGRPGQGEGELREPQGIAVDMAGDIYVTDALNHKLLKFKPDGTFVKEWIGPDTGFYGPREIEFGPDGVLYIVDQGRTRVARFDTSTEVFTVFGTAGTSDGQFNDPSGIAVGGGFVFVTDTGNGRIQTFDLNGTFVRQWPIPQWQNDVQFFTDVVFDPVSQHLYISSGKTREILVFDLDGNPLPGFRPDGKDELKHPSSMAIRESGKVRSLLVLDTATASVSSFALASVKK
jgi:DNA-binding beta-propeller fold protein YncE